MDAPDDFDQKVQEMLVSVDYAGTYVNENQDTVTLTKKSDGTYDVVVSIVRLCQMEGDGNSFWHKKQPAAGMRRAVFI